MLSSSLNATRFAQKPLAQPSYNFAHVPAAKSDLRHSSLQYVDSREDFHSCMAEMLLLCKEATRRRRRIEEVSLGSSTTAAKPLSLEYLADRIDVDDPIFGFIVRTDTNEKDSPDPSPSALPASESDESPAEASPDDNDATAAPAGDGDNGKTRMSTRANSHSDSAASAASSAAASSDDKNGKGDDSDDNWRRGMLQGFITCTTFTNYQKTFQWDSRNPVAILFDDEHHPPHPTTIATSAVAAPVDAANQDAATVEDNAGDGPEANGDGSSSSVEAAEQPMLPPPSVRARDEDGSLAAEMQATVRCGDVWNEGIVWPRIAEISLLGGLKCGKALVSLVIEHLECMKASGRCNYDYVVLQATDNSISFYEAMGFVRVGAVVKEENIRGSGDDRSGDSSASSCSDGYETAAMAEPLPEDSPEKANAVAELPNVVCSPTVPYTVEKGGDTPADVARKLDVDVWDIVFLNMATFPDIAPRSRLLVGTVLKVPAPANAAKPKADAQSRPSPQWYLAKENETPRMIARMFDVNCIDLVEANRHRLDGLLSNSRLKEGTRVQVSDFDLAHEGEYKPYAHWSFPDDQFEEPEPSYMMARRLDRRKGGSARERVFEASLSVPITQFEPPSLLLPLSPEPTRFVADPAMDLSEGASRRGSEHSRRGSAASASHRVDPNAPVPPKRPQTSFMVFGSEIRELHKDKIRGLAAIDIAKYVSNLWNDLTPAQKVKYEKKAEAYKRSYFREKAAYQEELEAYMASSATSTTESLELPALSNGATDASAAMTGDGSCARRPSMSSTSGSSLFNKVVKLKPGAMTEGSEYTYWYVLTFIPDLRWCHLAPMIPVGTFGADKPKCQGRPKYKLVDESLGKEVDISSSFCIPIKSRSMKRTLDADKEEWDIIDDGTIDDSCDASVRAFTRNVSRTSYASYSQSSLPTDVPRRFTTCDRLPMLTAVWKRREVSVRVLYGLDQAATAGSSAASKKRSGLFLDDSPASLWSATDGSEYDERPRKRARPAGSKNRSNGMEFKRGPGRPRKDSQNYFHSDAARAISFSVDQPPKRGPGRPPKTSLKPPPQESFSHVPMFPSYPGASSPITSSPRSTARARSQPPSSSRTSPGRAAALLSLGHHQLLHSPLVRVRHTRPIVPEVVRFSLPPSPPPPPPPPAPVARSSRGRSLTPSNRVSSFVRFNEFTQPSRSRSLDRDRSAPKQRKPPSAPRRHSTSSAKTSPILDVRWKNYALKLKAFREKHGTCRVPRVLPEDQSFANWVHNQRYSKTLTKERIDLLNEIGFEWLPLSTPASRGVELSGAGSSGPAGPAKSAAAEEQASPQATAQGGQDISRDTSTRTEIDNSNRDDCIQGEAVESETTAVESEPAASESAPTAGESEPVESEKPDVPSSPQASRWSRRARGRQPEPRTEATQAVVSNDESSVSPPFRESNDDELREKEPSEPPQEQTPAVQSGGVRTARRSKRQKWTADEPPEDSSLLVAPSIPPTETIAEDLPGATSMGSPLRAVAAPASPTSLTAIDEVVETITRGRSRTRAVVSAPTPTRKGCSQPARDKDDGSDADDSSESSEVGSRRHCNSPLVRRSIRKRKGRHVSQRNEVPAPDSPLAQEETPRSPSRKRHKVSSISEMETAKGKSPVKKASSHKGTMSRELLSLLQDYRPRNRRTGSVPGSTRRSVLQN